ncbi:hypothetical protein ACIOEX_20115 [Streptomyces sp. NPDC087850]|uniref:hypothetical protein n=1 Tax=Streptomyces sp. NPDC087850 TaxID=3365809 RepID=UPI00381EDFFF
MATAVKKTVTTTEFMLSLTMDEVVALVAVLSSISGTTSSPRRHTDAVLSGLHRAGASRCSTANHVIDQLKGKLDFYPSKAARDEAVKLEHKRAKAALYGMSSSYLHPNF